MTRVAPAPLGPALAVVVGARALTRAATVVVGLWMLVGVFVLVGVEEILGALPPAVDVASRATIAGLGALAMVAVVGEAVRVVLERALRMRAALRLVDAGAPMVPAAERAQLVRGAVGPSRVLLGVVGGGGVVAALIVLGLADGDAGLVAGGVVALVVGAVLMVVAIVVLAPASRRWREQVARLEAAWPRLHDVDEPIAARIARERKQRRLAAASSRTSAASSATGEPSTLRLRPKTMERIDGGLRSLVIVAFLLIVAGVMLRKQCRGCEPLRYDPWGESLVDGVAVVGIVLFVVALALSALRGIAWVVEQAVRERTAVAEARVGALHRSAWLDGALGSMRSLEAVALVVGVAGMIAAGLVVASGADATFMDEPEERFAIARGWAALAPVAGTLLAAALALGVAGAVAARRWRAEVWADLPADPFAGRVEGDAVRTRNRALASHESDDGRGGGA